MPESVLSRLARSTELSKTESRSAGAVRIQSRRTRYKSESDCPRNLSTIRAAQNPVNASPSQNFHVISTVGKICRGGLGSKKARSSARWYGLPLRSAHFGAGRSGRQKIEKRTYFWRSLPWRYPSETYSCFRIKPRGRGDL